MAYAATGRFGEAEKELAAVAARKDDASLKNVYVSNVNSAMPIANIAYELAAGELRARQKRAGEAVKHFAAAAALEDGLTYMEPPDWPIPVRQLQGAALLSLGRAAEAEKAYREDLKRFPNNGWSLSGLRESRIRQGRERDGETIVLQMQLQQAWRRADVKIEAGRVVQ
jgi:Flp pilus assembly protein TadD